MASIIVFTITYCVWKELTTSVSLKHFDETANLHPSITTRTRRNNMNCKKSVLWSLFCVAFGLSSTFAEQQTDGMCVESPGDGTCSPMEIPPMIDGKAWLSGIQKDKDVFGCCQQSDKDTVDQLKPPIIGSMPQFSTEDTMQVLEKAKKAWNHGAGVWPQMSLKDRIAAIETFLDNLQSQRSAIIQILMWEIGKNYKDAASEFDRTIEFCKKVIGVLQSDPEYMGVWQTIGSTKALVRRAAIGIILALGPYNYPLNETYATIIPALLMGNIVLLKIPTVGGLVHFLTSKYSSMFDGRFASGC